MAGIGGVGGIWHGWPEYDGPEYVMGDMCGTYSGGASGSGYGMDGMGGVESSQTSQLEEKSQGYSQGYGQGYKGAAGSGSLIMDFGQRSSSRSAPGLTPGLTPGGFQSRQGLSAGGMGAPSSAAAAAAASATSAVSAAAMTSMQAMQELFA